MVSLRDSTLRREGHRSCPRRCGSAFRDLLMRNPRLLFASGAPAGLGRGRLGPGTTGLV